jgi:menaquinone-9 beta-reductase
MRTMGNQVVINQPNSRVLVAGAGPAGSSIAIRLAMQGFEVTLVEREKFPRQKLCGEFVSPECLAHFRDLGVLGDIFDAGGEQISQTIFYEPRGRSVSVASEWFSGAGSAIGISRAEMDFRLMEKARFVGVRVLEETQVTDVLTESGRVSGVRVRSADGEVSEIAAAITIDATGRARVLEKLTARKAALNSHHSQSSKIKNQRSPLVGFKAHLKGVSIERGSCEIYVFPGGYGGLNLVENGAANHCFLAKPGVVKEFGGDADAIVRNVIFRNSRARETMETAQNITPWLAVSVDGFGLKNLNPAGGLFTVGDAAAFIDPFTGSGILMALESAEILARVISENVSDPAAAARVYAARHTEKFSRRLKVCSLLRRAAFAPGAAGYLIMALSLSASARALVARSTRAATP